MKSNYAHLKLNSDAKNRVFVSFHLHGKRYRFYNANILSLNIKPNLQSGHKRKELGAELFIAYRDALKQGWHPQMKQEENPLLNDVIESFKLKPGLTEKYAKDVLKTLDRFKRFMISEGVFQISTEELNSSHIQKYLQKTTHSVSTYNHERKRLHSIFSQLSDVHSTSNPVSKTKKLKEAEGTHKPFSNVAQVLEEIREFNESLYLCCLITYGCLLRPHQEIRRLTWGDFSDDLRFIQLSGNRNKSKRNRTVPVPEYVHCHLEPKATALNIFTGTLTAYNPDYFKTLWRRYKKKSILLEPEQTMYSFRHTGAINVFENSGSLPLLQQAMGHSSLLVTLRYLRGLNYNGLTHDMMPSLNLSS
jgi:integrase